MKKPGWVVGSCFGFTASEAPHLLAIRVVDESNVAVIMPVSYSIFEDYIQNGEFLWQKQ
jgi:hypothetical protein